MNRGERPPPTLPRHTRPVNSSHPNTTGYQFSGERLRAAGWKMREASQSWAQGRTHEWRCSRDLRRSLRTQSPFQDIQGHIGKLVTVIQRLRRRRAVRPTAWAEPLATQSACAVQHGHMRHMSGRASVAGHLSHCLPLVLWGEVDPAWTALARHVHPHELMEALMVGAIVAMAHD
jgi:hypothetical protein